MSDKDINTSALLPSVLRKKRSEVIRFLSNDKNVILVGGAVSLREKIMRDVYDQYRRRHGRENTHYLTAKTTNTDDELLSVINTFTLYASSSTGFLEYDALRACAKRLLESRMRYTFFISIDFDDIANNVEALAKKFAEYPKKWYNYDSDGGNNENPLYPRYVISTNNREFAEYFNEELKKDKNYENSTQIIDVIDSGNAGNISALPEIVVDARDNILTLISRALSINTGDIVNTFDSGEFYSSLQESLDTCRRIMIETAKRNSKDFILRQLLNCFAFLPCHPYSVDFGDVANIFKLINTSNKKIYGEDEIENALNFLCSMGWLYTRKSRKGHTVFIMDPLVATNIRDQLKKNANKDQLEDLKPLFDAIINWRFSGTTNGCACNGFLSIIADSLLSQASIDDMKLISKKSRYDIWFLCQTASLYMSRVNTLTNDERMSETTSASSENDGDVSYKSVCKALVNRAAKFIKAAEQIISEIINAETTECIYFLRSMVSCVCAEVSIGSVKCGAAVNMKKSFISAEKNISKAKKELSKSTHEYSLWLFARLYAAEGALHEIKNEYREAETVYNKALLRYRRLEAMGCADSALSVAAMYRNLGTVRENLEDYYHALIYMEKSERKLNEIKNNAAQRSEEFKHLSDYDINLVMSRKLADSYLSRAQIYRSIGSNTISGELKHAAYRTFASAIGEDKAAEEELQTYEKEYRKHLALYR